MNVSSEYEFVSPEEYTVQKTRSSKWDEKAADGALYGMDVAVIEELARSGVSLFTCLIPHKPTIVLQKELFGCQVVSIFVNVPLAVANERLRMRGDDNERRIAFQSTLDMESCAQYCDHCFTTTDNLELDATNFFELIVGIVCS